MTAANSASYQRPRHFARGHTRSSYRWRGAPDALQRSADRLRFIAILAVAVCLAGPSCGGADCLSLAKEYADEVPNALACDPNDPNSCSVARPVVVWEQNGTQRKLEGLGTCKHSDNPAKVDKLDQILAQFNSRGCQLLPLPICPAPQNVCMESAPGQYACAP